MWKEGDILSRRNFLKFSGSVAGLVLASKYLPPISETKVPQRKGAEVNGSPSNIPINEEAVQNLHKFADTLTRTTAFTGAEFASTILVSAYGAPIGSRVNEEDVRLLGRASLGGILEAACIPATALEIVRWTSNAFLPKEIADSPQTNFIQAALFALVANVKNIKDPETGSVDPHYFIGGKLPLYQFAEAYFFWNILREKGLPHSIFAHSLNNFIKLFLGKALYRFSPTTVTTVISTTTEAVAVDAVKEGIFNKIKRAFRSRPQA